MPTLKDMKRLSESRNVGEWLESRLHLMFTEITDGMFGEGKLTRVERIGLSSAIGKALDAFRQQVEAVAKQLYSRDLWEEPPAPDAIQESLVEGGFVPLVERAIRRDGTVPIKLIAPGWGSSGYYAAEVLQRDGPNIFTPGVKMYWNHPTVSEEAERPEGDLNTLAAELVSPARWLASGTEGPGLYADAKVFEAYQKPINELAPHIGVSIRALGTAVQGEAEGRKGSIIQSIRAARSVDFVTEPGAGGKIVEMFEAARTGYTGSKGQSFAVNEEHMITEQQFKEAQDRIAALEQDNRRLRESLVLSQARQMAEMCLAQSTLPEVTQVRMIEALALNPPTRDGSLDKEAFAARISEAIKAESDYLTQIGVRSGAISGMGSNGAPPAIDETALSKRLTEGFAALGLDEKAVKIASVGRL